MSIPADSLRTAMATKTDEELYDVVSAHSADYTQEALEAAKAELASRNLDAPSLVHLDNSVAEKIRLEQEPLEWRRRITAFFISPMLLFIPTLLGHRRYVERGEKRKAREWARCAWLGFGFYVLLAMLGRLLGD